MQLCSSRTPFLGRCCLLESPRPGLRKGPLRSIPLGWPLQWPLPTRLGALWGGDFYSPPCLCPRPLRLGRTLPSTHTACLLCEVTAVTFVVPDLLLPAADILCPLPVPGPPMLFCMLCPFSVSTFLNSLHLLVLALTSLPPATSSRW